MLVSPAVTRSIPSPAGCRRRPPGPGPAARTSPLMTGLLRGDGEVALLSQRVEDLVGHLRRRCDPGDDGPRLVGLQRLEGRQLAAEQQRRHVVAAALLDPVADQPGVGADVGEPDRWVPIADQVPVGALERRAGDDGVAPGGLVLPDPRGQSAQPGPAVAVLEGVAGAHLLDVLRRMEVVALGEVPPEAGDELAGHRRLAGSGDAHHDDRRGPRPAGALRHALTLCPRPGAQRPGAQRPGARRPGPGDRAAGQPWSVRVRMAETSNSTWMRSLTRTPPVS